MAEPDHDRIVALEATLKELKERMPTGSKDHEMIVTLSEQVKSLEKSGNSQMKTVWTLLVSGTAFVLGVFGIFWHVENKSLQEMVTSTLTTNAIITASNTASNAAVQAVADAKAVKQALSDAQQAQQAFQKRIQFGSVPKKDPNHRSVKVAFPKPFSKPPHVVLSSHWDGNWVPNVETISSITAEGFTFASDNFAPNYSVDWIAIEP